MANIKLVLAYDGSHYNGWQKQPPDKGIGVQTVLEKALSKLCGEPIEVFGAGRTDTGVHALGQVVNFHTTSALPADKYALAIRKYLPDDVDILAGECVADDWHARYCARGKVYRYTVALGESGVFNRHYAYFYPYKKELNVDLMEQAAQLFCGTHDFAAFRALGGSAKTTVRMVESFTLQRQRATPELLAYQQMPACLIFEVQGSGFLYKQVRLMIGALLAVGAQKITIAQIEQALLMPQKLLAPPAPACGLTLQRVLY